LPWKIEKGYVMGILDDLAMGVGLKERTEDYDARTARTLALSEQYGNEEDRLRARASGAYDIGTGSAAQYLGSRGYDEGYTPQVADDDRPFMQRLMTSPTGDPSPTPYAIGPLTMDQPLPQFGLLGLFTKGLSSMFQGGDDSGEMGPPRTTVRPMLRPDGFTPPTFPTNNGQPETTFTEDFSGVDVYNPETDYIEPDFSGVIPATTTGQDFATNQDFLDTVQAAIDMTTETGKAPLSNANYYDPSGAFGMRSGTSSIRRLPNGKFVDILTGKYF
jgi:hypothetical protein